MRILILVSVALLALSSCSQCGRHEPVKTPDKSIADSEQAESHPIEKKVNDESNPFKQPTTNHLPLQPHPEPRKYQVPTETLDSRKAGRFIAQPEDSLALYPGFGQMILPAEPAETFTSINSYFIIDFDNDIFTGKDIYFTNGAELSLIRPSFGNNLIARLLPSAGKGAMNHFGISIRQNMYTSTNPEQTEIDVNDRPFSGVLLAELFKISTLHSRQLRLTQRIQIGFIGEASLAASIQRLVHHLFPLGWQFQVRDDLLVNLESSIEKQVLSERNFRLSFSATGRLGTYLTTAGAAIHLKAGRIPLSFSPFATINPHTAEYEGNRHKLLWWFFGEANETYTLYNASLQGGLLNRNNPLVIERQRLNRIVIQAASGLALAYGATALQLKFVYLTPEFSSGKPHSWGTVNLLFNL